MGTGQSRNDIYYNAINNKTTLNVENVNPYVVLDIKEGFTWDELVKAYRHTAKKVHPDKGGSEEAFNIVTACFKSLAEEYKQKLAEKPHHVLKQEYNEYVPPRASHSGVLDIPNFQEKFNTIFDKNKLDDDDNERGYGHMMESSTKKREDFKIKKLLKKFDEKTFNDTFDSVVKPSKDIIIYKEPEPLLLSKKLDFTELGGKTEDFTISASKESSLHYTDYLQAHTNSRLVDPRAVTVRKQYCTVADYENDRKEAVEKQMDDSEIRYTKQKEVYRIKKEEERVQRLHTRDTMAASHYEKVNQLMLN